MEFIPVSKSLSTSSFISTIFISICFLIPFGVVLLGGGFGTQGVIIFVVLLAIAIYLNTRSILKMFSPITQGVHINGMDVTFPNGQIFQLDKVESMNQFTYDSYGNNNGFNSMNILAKQGILVTLKNGKEIELYFEDFDGKEIFQIKETFKKYGFDCEKFVDYTPSRFVEDINISNRRSYR